MKKALNENELNKVAGGNYDDKDLEFSSTPEGVKYLYNVGDHVEVYSMAIHTVTKSATVIERRAMAWKVDCHTMYCGEYLVEYTGTGVESWVNATDIERN